MKRSALVYAALTVMVMAVLVAGCRSASGTSAAALQSAENEVTLVGYQTGSVASSFDSLGMEVTMPLWFVSGK